MNLTENQKHILFHSLGLDDNGHGREYRNYYCQPIDFESDTLTEIKALVEEGLMKPGLTINEGKDRYFIVTETGKERAMSLVKPPPSLTGSHRRYRD